MATSELDIVNSALAQAGAEPINSLSGTDKASKVANREYPKLRDRLLVAHPWNFAIVRAELSEDATFDPETSFEWTNRFPLPNNCLRVVKTDLPVDDDWAVEENYLYCNSSAVKIKYIKKVTEVGRFSEGFVDALSLRLSSVFALSLAQNASLAKQLLDLYILTLKDAKSFDAQEGSLQVVEANTWLNSRY